MLLNRKEMAAVFWRRCAAPARSAISAAYMLQEMSKRDGVEHAVRDKMLENARFFEECAIGVFKQAAKSDRHLANKCLDCSLRLWTGKTLLDLAVKAKCHKFVDECCQEALLQRMYGDINPYQNSFWKILCVLLSLGLLAGIQIPLEEDKRFCFIVFNPPPFDDVVRCSTQRRKIPPNYPHHPFKSRSNMPIGTRKGIHQGMLKNKEIKDLSPSQLNELWAHTFTFRERFHLFWKSPYVLYLTNTLLSWVITLMFSYHFVYNAPMRESEVVSEPLHVVESIMIAYHVCVVIRELLQMSLETDSLGDFWDYLVDPRNLFDWVAMVCFVGGLFSKHSTKAELNAPLTEMDPWLDGHIFACGKGSNATDCADGEGSDAPFTTEFHRAELLFGFSIFFMYLKLLYTFSLNKNLSILVRIFTSMLLDVSRFMFIYMLFLFAFAFLMIGAGTPDAVVDSCGPMTEGGSGRRVNGMGLTSEERYEFMSCWRSYWFFRTVFQAFGEFYMDEMTNTWAVIFVIMVFLLLNVVLMNLLIAMMASTYEKVQEQANLNKELDYYHIILAGSRYAASLPPPLNVIGLLFQCYKFKRQSKEISYYWPRTSLRRRFDLFLARNTRAFYAREIRQPIKQKAARDKDTSVSKALDTKNQIVQSISSAKNEEMKMRMFMEHARKDYLLSLEEQNPAAKMEARMNHLEKLLEKMEHRLTASSPHGAHGKKSTEGMNRSHLHGSDGSQGTKVMGTLKSAVKLTMAYDSARRTAGKGDSVLTVLCVRGSVLHVHTDHIRLLFVPDLNTISHLLYRAYMLSDVPHTS